MVSTIEEASIGHTFSEIACDIALQNVVFGSSPTFVRDAQKCPALRNFTQFLHQLSSFNTVFQYIDHQKFILMQNKHDIRNQHKKLHRIG